MKKFLFLLLGMVATVAMAQSPKTVKHRTNGDYALRITEDSPPTQYWDAITSDSAILTFQGTGLVPTFRIYNSSAATTEQAHTTAIGQGTELVVEGADGGVDILSNDNQGSWGAFITLGTINNSGDLVNKWSMIRQTGVAGDNTLRFTYGTSRDPSANTTMMTLHPTNGLILDNLSFVPSGTGTNSLLTGEGSEDGSGDNNTIYGSNSFTNSSGQSASGNTFVGSSIALGTTSLTTDNNTAIGYDALGDHGAGGSNTAIGANALADHPNGTNNTAVGRSAMQQNDGGTNNVAVGINALDVNNSLCDYNTAIGASAGTDFSTGGDYNVYVGYQSGRAFTSGDNNIFIGAMTNTQALTSGDDNVVIGNPFAGIMPASATGNIFFCDGGGGAGSTNIRLRYNSSNTAWEFGNHAITLAGLTSQGNGTINATAVYDNGVILTDYVFEEHYLGYTIDQIPEWYSPKTIKQERRYVKRNKSLSLMPTRKEWEKEGAPSTGEMVSRLTAIVETQFLYIEELERRISELEKN